MGRGGGQVVSEFAFLSDNPSSNPAAAYSFYVKFVFEKNKNKQEEAGFGPFFKKSRYQQSVFTLPTFISVYNGVGR